MREINCNIIRDLLPSYVDGICSEDSRLLIEEHVTDCEQCRTRLEMLKDTALTDEQGGKKTIFYLKKVKKGIISFILLTLAIIIGFMFMIHQYGVLENHLFYMIFPLPIIAAYCMMPDSPLLAKHSKISGILIAVSSLLMVYFAVLVYWSIQMIESERALFDIPMDEAGPFLGGQLILIAVMQIGIFILSNIVLFSGYQIHQCIYGLTLTGLGLAAGYLCILHNMTTVEGFYRLLSKMIGCIVLEGIGFSMAAHIFAKRVIR
ncbi:MAG: zf-HC2 domain-containing protein [Lachnospiraceae bacterium]|nr:zf-HC2 domain-containing protein [Lachnospiraceae bacterium]